MLLPAISDGATHIVEKFDFKEVLLGVMLNFLLFAGALSVNLKTLLEERVPVLILAHFWNAFIHFHSWGVGQANISALKCRHTFHLLPAVRRFDLSYRSNCGFSFSQRVCNIKKI